MSDDVGHRIERITADTIAGLVTHKDPVMRVAGRLLATGMSEKTFDWAVEEMDRGASYSHVVSAIITCTAQCLASVVASLGGLPESDKVLADLFGEKFTSHVAIMRNSHPRLRELLAEKTREEQANGQG